MSEYTSIEQRASYGVGRQMGEQLAANPFDGIDIEAVAAGVSDALNKVSCPISDADMNAAFAVINEQMKAKQAEKAQSMSAEGAQFLAENAKKDGVTVTETGLQYEIINTGDGEKPNAGSTVRTHYHGSLMIKYQFNFLNLIDLLLQHCI